MVVVVVAAVLLYKYVRSDVWIASYLPSGVRRPPALQVLHADLVPVRAEGIPDPGGVLNRRHRQQPRFQGALSYLPVWCTM